jgi:hypothetical protein
VSDAVTCRFGTGGLERTARRSKASSDDKALYAKFKQLNHKQLKLLKVLRDSVGDRDRAAFKRAVKQGKKVSKKNDRVATKHGAPACAS